MSSVPTKYSRVAIGLHWAIGFLTVLNVQMDDGTNGKQFFAGGQPADYTITVQNIGTADAHNASVQDSLPANLLGARWA